MQQAPKAVCMDGFNSINLHELLEFFVTQVMQGLRNVHGKRIAASWLSGYLLDGTHREALLAAGGGRLREEETVTRRRVGDNEILHLAYHATVQVIFDFFIETKVEVHDLEVLHLKLEYCVMR